MIKFSNYCKGLNEGSAAGADTPGMLFGSLMQSVVEVWKFHLLTESYAVHDALNDYYNEAPKYIDAMVEHFISVKGKERLGEITDILSAETDVITYLGNVRTILVQYRNSMFTEDAVITKDIDDLLGLVDSTLYKVKNLA